MKYVKSVLNNIKSSTNLIFLLALLGHVGLAWLQYKLPSTDVFLFKDAGANLALTGRFEVADLPHLDPHVSSIFAYYPPVYPLMFGLWSKLYHIGLTQSLLFDALIRMLRAVLMFMLVFSGPSRAVGNRNVILILCLSLSFVAPDSDRPDDLGALFGFLSVLAWGSSFKSALFLGLAAATSPASGLFFGVFTMMSLSVGSFRKRLSLCLLGVLVFLLLTVPIQWADRDAYLKFSRQLPLTLMPYLKPYLLWGTKMGAYYAWRGYFYRAFYFALPCMISLIALFCVALVGRFFFRKELSAWFWASVSFVILWLVIWPIQPFYLWFAILALTVQLLQRSPTLRTAIVVGFIYSPLYFQEAKAVFMALQRPKEESISFIQQKLLPSISEYSTVAITSDQYFTFKGKRRVVNMTYVCDYLKDFEFAYVSRLKTSKLSEVNYPFYCSASQEYFKPWIDLSAYRPIKLAFTSLPYLAKGSSGILYRNIVLSSKPTLDLN